MGTTQGTPSSVPRLARFWSQIATTTMPTAAIRATLITVRLARRDEPAAAAPRVADPDERTKAGDDDRHADPAHGRVDGAPHEVVDHLLVVAEAREVWVTG